MELTQLAGDTTIAFALPPIPRDKRIVPNELIRSSLFTVANHHCPRDYLKNKSIASFRSTEMHYTGEELRQDDQDVWLQLIFLAAAAQTNEIFFKPYTFLSDVGWPQRTQYRDRLKASLTRMSATTLEIYNAHFEKGIAFSLVRKFEWYSDEKQLSHWRVWLEPEVLKLFGELGRMYTKIHWGQRIQLKPLARWLHAFYSSHAEPEPVHLYRLMALCGSRTKHIKHFKANLRSALLELIKIGFLTPDVFIDEHYFLLVSRKKELYKQVTHE
ncbi:MAG: hypothetical protein COY58_00300 [Gammaproteobacteria bacterium CG_4_10_14_0_8_um_filter_38_16]|nr:MAG: hypothetical protein COY58_00300 [Gammaproteobacteria bacterium CG_4_10_14_0_8_um_filter_38_16]PJA02764.1 MAG: hypothetical protein COX72_08215 [Gammaproteobacteria bacterium CG_4_10_14_0_2_um_filter_38_22]PJB10412.1 MAG: hypothetical protein CO120_04985 [Gammaproteobacteria bacterium CG_4_9_14_3_um_filter_38_9]